MEKRRREVVVLVGVKSKRISTMFQEGGVSEGGGGRNNGGALKLQYKSLRSLYKYLLVPPFLKLPCPQTMVSVTFSSSNKALGV